MYVVEILNVVYIRDFFFYLKGLVKREESQSFALFDSLKFSKYVTGINGRNMTNNNKI